MEQDSCQQLVQLKLRREPNRKGKSSNVEDLDEYAVILHRVIRIREKAPGENPIMKDDYGRVEIAKNLGRFLADYPIEIGDKVEISLISP